MEHWRRYREKQRPMSGGRQMTYLDMDPAPPLMPGTVRITFGPVPPGWLKCDGAVVLIQDHPDLFAAIGVQFGGDGSTTFALPKITTKLTAGNTPEATWMMAS